MKVLTHQRRSVSANCAFFLVLLTATGAMAQYDKPPVPHEPLLARAPEMAAWTITYQYPLDAKAKDKKKKALKGLITSVDIEKTDNVYHKVTHFDTGSQSEAWCVGGHELLRENADVPFALMPSSGPITDDYSKSDFEDLDWLNMKNYAGLEKSDHPGFVFRATYKTRAHTRREKTIDTVGTLKSFKEPTAPTGVSVPNGDPVAVSDQHSDSESTVILDTKTQLPMEYDQGAVKWSYHFLPTPTSPLTPPPEVSTILTQWDKFNKASQSSASPP